jgi:hypothetical protein
MITLMLFAAAFVTMPVVVLLTMVGKRTDVTLGDIYWEGSAIYRRLDRYLRRPYVKPVLVFSYLSVGLFIAAVLSALVIGLWRKA